MPVITPEAIMRIAMGFMAAKHLFVATAIGIFEKLADVPATPDELAAKCGIPVRTLRISADAMVSLGLLERDGDRYRNTAVTAAYLAGAVGPDLRPAMHFLDRISYPTWMNLEEAVRRGEGPSRRSCREDTSRESPAARFQTLARRGPSGWQSVRARA